MKKCTSPVWQFFERIEDQEIKRCVGVICKLCENQYKYFGNTTNLRVHLVNKHPLQWGLYQSGNLDPVNMRVEEVQTQLCSAPKRRRVRRRRKSKKVNSSDETDSDFDETNEAGINLVRQMHADANSDVEWLEEDPYQITHIETIEPTKRKKLKYKRIKREVASPTELPSYYVSPPAERSYVYHEESPKKDEFSVFGDYIANKLRKFKGPRLQGNLQQLITTMLWQAEYGFYDKADVVKRVLTFSISDQNPDQSASTIQYDAPGNTVQNEEMEEPSTELGSLNVIS